ncbi:MAG TPA: ABC transporter ATP-binding protein, partial [Nitrolancea sp.]|nr:ABC transporter ATP-binding protein [Nitrolancea sp.]
MMQSSFDPNARHIDPIRVRNLRVDVRSSGNFVVEDFNLDLRPGEVVGLVGESGSGKTTAGLALLGYARPGLTISKGSVNIDGVEILKLSGPAMLEARRKLVSYVPQDPSAALNPALRIRTQLAEKLSVRSDVRDSDLVPFLREVMLPATGDFLNKFPHEMSGGQQQRVGIAMAFASRPRLIVMDEPTTGLDVTTQAHVLKTVESLCSEHQVACLYVSHDLAVVAGIAQRVAVMYSGRVVEIGPTQEVLFRPEHPYTRALIRAVPSMKAQSAMHGIPGQAPDVAHRPTGCSFSDRCDLAIERCHEAFPAEVKITPEHTIRCWNFAGAAATLDRERTREMPRSSGHVLLDVRNLSASYAEKEVLHDL